MEEFPMHVAAVEGDTEGVKRLIELGMSVDCQDREGTTPLHKAACYGHSEVVELLIRSKCDVNRQVPNGYTPLCLSAMHGHKGVVDLLLLCGALFSGGRRCSNPAHNIDEVLFATLLHWASVHGWVDIIQRIVESGKDVADAKTDEFQQTPLMWAAASGQNDAVLFLIQAGADVNRVDISKSTALHFSSMHGHLEVVQILIQEGADINHRDLNESTALHFASENGHLEIVQSLLEKEGVDLNPQDCLGETPLHIACQQGELEAFERLLDAGADPCIENDEGETAFRVALSNEAFSLKEIRLFLQKGVFFEDCDYAQILENSDLKEHVLKDVEICTQSIINKFHYQALPALYSNHGFAKKLPQIWKLKLNDQEVREIENFVELDIKTNMFCNVVKARPIVLKVMCVNSLISSPAPTIKESRFQ